MPGTSAVGGLVSGRELTAARVIEPRLREAYARCRRLHARHGRTYFLATRLLRPAQRPAIHALYGFARYVDDLVDDPEPGWAVRDIAERIDHIAAALADGLATGATDDPVLAAVVDTTARFGVDPELFGPFLDSMRMDLTVSGYPSRTELDTYVHGSAEVIGLQVLPVLGTVCDRREAEPHAAALGAAFQLTNFLRDVAEDLRMGRVYLPADELAAYGVDTDLLRWCLRNGRAEPKVRAALADQVARTREVYRRARPGIGMLHPASRPCVATALDLYSRILDRIEDRDHDVFSGRAVVGTPRRLALAGAAVARTALARTTTPTRATRTNPAADLSVTTRD
ncbi:phytoene synthase [Saccharomonospora amisosensis]|uniref:Phytoene synthase n=1 Tax=Saccharomonospora amisosensis TaxID=1128677 RepID=A0A7X5UPD5_9PSEU|nr:phytoene/squalene synthase family protein [Saccharomonospora amisosensis]NIJ11720.1 phytoene synthase [Saccharomonospora amisosensis]